MTNLYCYSNRDGRLKVNDELLMANGRSLVGMTHNEADLFLKSLPGMVQLVVATEVCFFICGPVTNSLIIIVLCYAFSVIISYYNGDMDG